ncbi:hypothetical protein PC116_g34900 [Phytophthora cactorum]|nr:hypothetical protein PC116_g34900 [Phytophthora cactorum]
MRSPTALHYLQAARMRGCMHISDNERDSRVYDSLGGCTSRSKLSRVSITTNNTNSINNSNGISSNRDTSSDNNRPSTTIPASGSSGDSG